MGWYLILYVFVHQIKIEDEVEDKDEDEDDVEVKESLLFASDADYPPTSSVSLFCGPSFSFYLLICECRGV